jgi:titin
VGLHRGEVPRTGFGGLLLAGLFIGALATGVGLNAGFASPSGLFDYYGAGVPGAPAAVSAVQGNGNATVHLHVPLSDGGAPIIAYVVTPYVGVIPFPPQTFTAARATVVVTGLTNGKTFFFKVAASNAVGTGPQSSASNAVTVGAPAAPTSVFAITGKRQATLTWVPGNTNGSPIIRYVVTPYIAGAAQRRRALNSSATTQAVGGLANGKSYTFKLLAENANGSGTLSASSNVVIVGAPAAPTGAHPVRIASGTFKVNFAPGSNDGAPITKYSTTCTSSNGGVTKTGTGTASPITVTGLTGAKSYTCTITATNSRGAGPASAPSAAVTA